VTNEKHVARHRLATRAVTPLSDIDPKLLAARGAATMTATGLVFTGIVGANAVPTPEVETGVDAAVDQLVNTLGSQNQGLGTIVSVETAWDSGEVLSATIEAPPADEEEQPEEEQWFDEPETVEASYEYGAEEVTVAATPAPVVDNSSVAAAAYSLVGIPYVWGGASLAGADCSGLVVLAYAAVGIWLPHQSEAILGSGTIVSSAEAMPGDVIWYPGHVAIYVGDGLMIEASSPGTLSGVSAVRGGGTFVRIG
jgi:Cell wall-associated hydrolases (invasion-associated proteins)